MRTRSQRGATAIEFLVVGMTLVLPLALAMFFTAQILWIWHSAAEITRTAARYAATHCYQGGNNVRTYLQTYAPPMPDREQFLNGSAQIVITYFSRATETNDLTEFTCESECSLGCVPDVVKVQITNYEYRNFLTYWGLPPVQLPDFQTTIPMEGAGCDPDTGVCNP
ncbi:MAG: pilus assembly protein [Bryobacter sp.]|jgi:Flp pilus assembly protein TadG|nr:pilus assembly protein [Bryobacter sp. CoA8 C33]